MTKRPPALGLVALKEVVVQVEKVRLLQLNPVKIQVAAARAEVHLKKVQQLSRIRTRLSLWRIIYSG